MHGDARPSNWMFQIDPDDSCINAKLLDHDWAGIEGHSVYLLPVSMEISAGISRPPGVSQGQLMYQEHDLLTLDAGFQTGKFLATSSFYLILSLGPR